MLVSGKESILDSIFRICCVPQEPESPLVKHRQVARHDIVQFLSALAKDPAANCPLSFDDRCYCRHNVSPLYATQESSTLLNTYGKIGLHCCQHPPKDFASRSSGD